MLSRFSLSLVAVFALGCPLVVLAGGSDRVILKNGREIDGNVVSGNAETITVRRGERNEVVERKLIRRVDDTATTGAYFVASAQCLPPWNAIVNDLRSDETIHSLRFVASGRAEDGPFAKIPYLVFRMNDAIELRIYGNPENPAGIQLGLLGGGAGDRAAKLRLRSFLAGFLTERSQIAALYDLKIEGGEKPAGDLRIAFGTRKNGEDSPNWWMAAWNPSAMQRSRGVEAAAARAFVTRGWESGFQRDRDGHLRALPSNSKIALGY